MIEQEVIAKKAIHYLSSEEGKAKLEEIAKELELQEAMIRKSKKLTIEQLNTPFDI